MLQQEIEDYLDLFPEAEIGYPFGPEARVYKVLGKMFALLAIHRGELSMTVKGTPADNELLVSQFKGIIPGYHMNKQHWVTVSLESDVNDGMIRDLAAQSYKLVVSTLPKAQQKRLQLLGA